MKFRVIGVCERAQSHNLDSNLHFALSYNHARPHSDKNKTIFTIFESVREMKNERYNFAKV